MSAQLEIIWTDRAGGAPAPMRTPGSAQPAERTPGPGDSVSGPQKRDTSLTNGADLESSAQKLANVLGVGGLMGSAIELRREFRKLFDAVSDSSRALKGVRGSDVGGARIGEFKSPASGTVATEGPAAPSIPSVGTFERQAAKGAVEAPPVSRAVAGPVPSVGWFEKTVAAKGGAVAPPMVGSVAGPAAGAAAAGAGPAAGAGSAAGAMAALSVAAGPLAIAFAVTTAAVVAGAAAAKKFADSIANEADRISGYSADISRATAVADIRSQMTDLKRAQRIGPQMAGVVDRKSQFENEASKIWTSILQGVLELEAEFKPFTQAAIGLLEIIAKHEKEVVNGTKMAVEANLGVLPILNDISRATAKGLAKWIGDKEDEKAAKLDDDPERDWFMSAFLGEFNGKKPPAMAVPRGDIGPA